MHMKGANCGLAEAECEFEIKSKDGSTIQEAVGLCWACLDQRMGSIMERRNEMHKLRAYDKTEMRGCYER